ncbi:MAG: hypothetical protein GY714_20880 [Desulfobacterales bacterium]|nr:hypothetical protein [Desulfobacterales bacterium]
MKPASKSKKAMDGLIKKIIRAIEVNDLCFMCEIPLFVPYSLRYLYDKKLHELQDIKVALDKNKINNKMQYRRNWLNFTAAPTLQIAGYKLIATEDELKRLSNKPEININNVPVEIPKRVIYKAKKEKDNG